MKRKLTGTGDAPEQKMVSASRARRERRKNRIVELHLQSHSAMEIKEIMLAEENHSFGLDTISKYINEAMVAWTNTMNEMISNHKAIELQKINMLENEYWLAWRRSQRNQKSKSETKVPVATDEQPISKAKRSTGNKLQLTQVRTDDKEAVGDPKFLDGVYKCVEMRNKILGVEVPANMIQIQNNNQNNSSSTTIIRRVVFKTRETTTEQTIEEEEEK